MSGDGIGRGSDDKLHAGRKGRSGDVERRFAVVITEVGMLPILLVFALFLLGVFLEERLQTMSDFLARGRRSRVRFRRGFRPVRRLRCRSAAWSALRQIRDPEDRQKSYKGCDDASILFHDDTNVRLHTDLRNAKQCDETLQRTPIVGRELGTYSFLGKSAGGRPLGCEAG